MSKRSDNVASLSSKDEVTNVSDIVGPWGPWQRNIFFFFFIGAMCSAWHSLGLAFYAPNIDYWCKRPDNISMTVGLKDLNLECFKPPNTSIACNEWEYDHSFWRKSIISEWDIICDRSKLASATQSAYMAGVMVTVVVTGQLSDIFGRRPIIWAGVIIELLAGLSCAFSVSITHFMISRFWLAFGASARWGTGFVLILEAVGPQYRSNVGMAIQFGWAFGYIVLPGVAYVLRDFRLIQLACTIPEFVLLLWWCALPESPRWQLTHGKFKEAEKAMRNAAEINRQPTERIESKLKKLLEKSEADAKEEKEKNKRASFLDLWKSWAIIKNTLILYVTWFVNAFVYYGLSLNTNNLGGNPFINFLLAGAVEFPAYAISIYVLKKYGRRLPVVCAMLGGGLGCLATIPFMNDDYVWIRVTFAMIGKFCITCSFGMIYVYTAEIFPTVVRNIGVGSSSMVARVGSIIAPYVKELGQVTHLAVPLALFGIISLADGFLILMLPETKDKEIPDTIEEADNLHRQSKSDKKIKSQANGIDMNGIGIVLTENSQ